MQMEGFDNQSRGVRTRAQGSGLEVQYVGLTRSVLLQTGVRVRATSAAVCHRSTRFADSGLGSMNSSKGGKFGILHEEFYMPTSIARLDQLSRPR